MLPPHFLAAKEQAMMKARDYEQTHGLSSPPATSTTVASATVTSSMEAEGTVATTDAVPPKLPPQESIPPLGENYYPPAQEAAPMAVGIEGYPPLSQVILYLCHVHFEPCVSSVKILFLIFFYFLGTLGILSSAASHVTCSYAAKPKS